MNGLKIAVDEEKGVAYVQRSEWEALPKMLQIALKQRIEKEHGIKLTFELVDGDPHVEVDEQIEVDNLLMPDNVRSALCHYSSGVVAVTRTRRGWVRVYESGQHDCYEASPYDEASPPTAITILAYLPEEGIGSLSKEQLAAESARPFRPKGHPLFIDTSDSAQTLDGLDPDRVQTIQDRIGARLAEQGTLSLDDTSGSGEAALKSFEHMVVGSNILVEELDCADMPLNEAIILATTVGQFIMAKFVLRCAMFDRDEPEDGWDALRVAMETLAREPWEFFDGLDAELAKSLKANVQALAGGEALVELTNDPLFHRVSEAVAAGREFSEWRDDYYVFRMLTIVTVMRALMEAEI